MTGRSLQASPKGILLAKQALNTKRWKQTNLIGEVCSSRATISKFFNGKPVDGKIFVGLCEKLGLNWKQIADLPKDAKPEPTEQNQDTGIDGAGIDIDALAQEVRKKVRPSIQERCGTIRVLDMAQPIELNNIYTNVNILEKISGRRRLGIAELLQGFDPESEESESEEFDRFGLGRVSEERVPGLEAVERHPKLMVLGKPGAGKTTFLKYLAIQCICSEFQASRVPIFITLKQFAETRNYPELLEFIIQDLGKDAVTDTQATALINCGRALLLLDGLDEVREEDSSRVLRQIKEFSAQYRTNQFVITCRIAAREYTFEQFTEVEVADFDDKQIKTFVTKWFREKESDAPERFMQQLELNKPIKELATNPLLLTLLCLEFEDSGDFPSDRAELYNRAIHTLLRKWDTKRGIVRDEVYKKLAVRHKEDLLSEVAWTTFERKDYFFKQRDVERYIADYIRNLPDAQTDPDALQLDSEAVLKSIEAQHGLLVERARGIYSFSHLTFQEYFTAREIVFVKQSSEEALQKLVPHITKQRWREVFLLSGGMSPSADRLLQLMKQQVDALVAAEQKLQEFLMWVNQKCISVDFPYKPAAVRAFYFYLACERVSALSVARAIEPVISSETFDLDYTRSSAVVNGIDCALERAFTLERILAHSQTLGIDLALAFEVNFDIALDVVFELNRVLSLDLAPKQKQFLQQIQDQIPNPNTAKEKFKNWWQNHRHAWIEQLEAVMIEHRKISQNWQFSKQQRKLLAQYFDANKFLIDCLNSDCYVTRTVREEIEATLLLPMTEIEKHK